MPLYRHVSCRHAAALVPLSCARRPNIHTVNQTAYVGGTASIGEALQRHVAVYYDVTCAHAL